jgi:hypothetical protein
LLANNGIDNAIMGGIGSVETPNLLLSAGLLTTALFLFSLGIFLTLAIKSKTIKSFQSQISIFVGVYVVGEVLELNAIQTVTGLPVEIGSQIHVTATIIITIILWLRLFYSGRMVKKLVDRDESTNQT